MEQVKILQSIHFDIFEINHRCLRKIPMHACLHYHGERQRKNNSLENILLYIMYKKSSIYELEDDIKCGVNS